MNYEEALEYIHGISWCFCKPGLERITELCSRLGDPQNELKFIHVAGTNGKGSFCSMLTAVLKRAGYKIGTYTSPYIRFFNERMCINGEPISNEELAEITTYIKPIADSMSDKPTEFELITAVAFEYFKRNNCDVVVLEAGMGGRLDSTNVIRNPVLSVITGVALDHTAFLGDTVEKIAVEKAGIIKDKRPVLFGGEHSGARDVIRSAAELSGSNYFEVDYEKLKVNVATLEGTNFDFFHRKNMKVSLLGLYQPRNAAVVISAVDILNTCGFDIGENDLREGLVEARWQARFEILKKEPLIIFDGAHNAQGIDSAVASIYHYFGDRKVYVLTGVLADKDYRYIAQRLSEIAEKAFVMTPDNPRALASDEYADALENCGVSSQAFETLEKAYITASREALADGVPLVCLGSLYTYSELIKLEL